MSYASDALIDALERDVDRLERENGQLKYENDKLRELVVTLAACASVDDCDKCPINGAEFKANEVGCCYMAKQRMRDLGIEVRT